MVYTGNMSYPMEAPGSNPDRSVWLHDTFLAYVTLLGAVKISQSQSTAIVRASSSCCCFGAAKKSLCFASVHQVYFFDDMKI